MYWFSFDAYNEAGNLQDMAERFRQWEGHYPSRILADKMYRNRDNLRYCKEHDIHLTGPALGRPKKDEVRNKTRDFLGDTWVRTVRDETSMVNQKTMTSTQPTA